MKTIALNLLLFCNVMIAGAQAFQGSMVFSHHNSTADLYADTIYALSNTGQKTFITLGFRPAISHNGKYMAFENGSRSNQSLQASVWIRNLMTQKDTLIISNNSDYINYYNFSPDDSELVYDYSCGIYKSSIDGTNPYQAICYCNCYDDQPNLRTSDSEIVLHNVNVGLYTMNYNGSNLTTVPNSSPGDLYPVWSPDGQWIVYYKTTPGLSYVTNAIYKIKSDGSQKTLLLQLAAQDTIAPDPVWAADMQNIYFIARIQDSLGMYAVKTDGSGNYQKNYSFDTTGSINDYWLGIPDVTSGTLPLTLANFKAYSSGKGITTTWSGFNETGISGYDVERSVNGYNFNKLDNIPVKTNTAVQNNYVWFDASPFSGNNFYRIKAINKDGSVQYSSIIKVTIARSQSSIVVSPNPAYNKIINLKLNNVAAGNYNIRIYDTHGEMLYLQSFRHGGGNTSVTINLKNAAAGIYRIDIKNPDNNYHTTLVMQ